MAFEIQLIKFTNCISYPFDIPKIRLGKGSTIHFILQNQTSHSSASRPEYPAATFLHINRDIKQLLLPSGVHRLFKIE